MLRAAEGSTARGRPCRFTTYRHRFARVAPAPRAKKNRGRASPVKEGHETSGKNKAAFSSYGFIKLKRLVVLIGHRLIHSCSTTDVELVAVIPDPRAARSLRFSPSEENGRLISSVKCRTYTVSKIK